jgi:hypothetical protein
MCALYIHIVYVIVLLIGAAGTVPIERCISLDVPVKRYLEQQWYDKVNKECTCNTEQQQQQQCGDVCRQLLLEIREKFSVVQGTSKYIVFNKKLSQSQSAREQRQQLQQRMNALRCSWARSSSHSSSQSPTCDHVTMPSELLPRVSTVSTASQQQWRYLSQATVDNVRAIAEVRSCYARKSNEGWWHTLKTRLRMHARTGRGTVAEAIVLNDSFWYGSTAFAE